MIFSFIFPNGKTLAMNITSPPNNDNVNLIVDFRNPEFSSTRFRKTSSNLNFHNDTSLNLTGLNELNISGSRQFGTTNLSEIINAIGTLKPITIIDLRQESHGFINDLPVSWANSKNNANLGLNKKQVLQDEANKLKSVELNKSITFYNHPQLTIIPTKVQDEASLVKTKSLAYVRITVTDGKIPTDDMVDYFINFARTNNNWLHFHCKQGIGRTTTFMIMYDMMKNSKLVSLNDIIKRQLLLANFNSKEIDSFNNNERTAFLNKFYQYCRSNNDSYNLSWSHWNKTLNSSFNQLNLNYKYIKSFIKPKVLYVISLDNITSNERTMIATLQGLVSNHCSSQIYTLNSSEPDYKIWLQDLHDNYGITCKIISDPFQLLNIFKNNVSGYVIYNNKNPKDPSINNACSLASLNNCISINETLETKVKSLGLTLKGDCRNTNEYWAYNNLWNHGLNHLTVIELSPTKDSSLRDYAVMTKSLVFYEDNMVKTNLRDKIYSSMKDGGLAFGWGPDEFINVSCSSKYGVSLVPADWSYNLSVLSSFPCSSINQKKPVDAPLEKDKHYVTFLMSDGDNQQWNLGTNYGSSNWYGSTFRGDFKMGWSISPSLYYLAPTVFNLYYKNAKQDCFVISPSGNGYMYPSKFSSNKLDTFTKDLDIYAKEADENYVAIIDDNSLNMNKLWEKYTSKSNIKGLFYLDYHRQDNYHGEIIWSNNKPIVSCRDLLWLGLENETDLIKKINQRVDNGYTDIHSSNSYTFVYVHAWSKNMSNINTVVNTLKKNAKIKIITPNVFMESISKNVEH